MPAHDAVCCNGNSRNINKNNCCSIVEFKTKNEAEIYVPWSIAAYALPTCMDKKDRLHEMYCQSPLRSHNLSRDAVHARRKMFQQQCAFACSRQCICKCRKPLLNPPVYDGWSCVKQQYVRTFVGSLPCFFWHFFYFFLQSGQKTKYFFLHTSSPSNKTKNKNVLLNKILLWKKLEGQIKKNLEKK